jgi:hypothetical protein
LEICPEPHGCEPRPGLHAADDSEDGKVCGKGTSRIPRFAAGITAVWTPARVLPILRDAGGASGACRTTASTDGVHVSGLRRVRIAPEPECGARPDGPWALAFRPWFDECGRRRGLRPPAGIVRLDAYVDPAPDAWLVGRIEFDTDDGTTVAARRDDQSLAFSSGGDSVAAAQHAASNLVDRHLLCGW